MSARMDGTTTRKCRSKTNNSKGRNATWIRHPKRPFASYITRRDIIIVPGFLAFPIVATTLSGKRALAENERRTAGDWSSPGLASVDDELPRYEKTELGIPYQSLLTGSGPSVSEGDNVVIDYVLRRSNGYFIYGTVEGISFQPVSVPTEPFRFKVGDVDTISGLSSVLIGMQAGGKRRALIPPSRGYTESSLLPQPPTFGTKRQLLNHTKEPLLFEIQLLKVQKKQ